MVEARGRRLNPPQAAAAHHLWPGNRHFRVAAKHVGLGQFLGDPLLPGINDVVPRGGGADLDQVFLLDRITKNNAHAELARVDKKYGPT